MIEPADSVVPPEQVLVPVSVSVPVPCLTRLPVPLIAYAWVELSDRSKMSVPLSTTAVVIAPVVPPVPIWSLPPALRLMVPDPPRESVPATRTSPPLIVSVPLPS